MSDLVPDPDEEFEAALQAYIAAVTAYKTACYRYTHAVDPAKAWQMIMVEARNRICYADTAVEVEVLTQEEVNRYASQARPIIDAERG